MQPSPPLATAEHQFTSYEHTIMPALDIQGYVSLQNNLFSDLNGQAGLINRGFFIARRNLNTRHRWVNAHRGEWRAGMFDRGRHLQPWARQAMRYQGW